MKNVPLLSACDCLEVNLPHAFQELSRVGETLERHFQDAAEVEFVVENGRLFVLAGTRGRKTRAGNLRTALRLLLEKRITVPEVLVRIQPEDISDMVQPRLENPNSLTPLARGLGACLGMGTGPAAFNPAQALDMAGGGETPILLLEEASIEHIAAELGSAGVVVTRGGITSHAAMHCRGMGKPCVAGLQDMRLSQDQAVVGNAVIRLGEIITIDGHSGWVFKGRGIINQTSWHDYSELRLVAKIIRTFLFCRQVPRDLLGKAWLIWDYFCHQAPLLFRPSFMKPVPQPNEASPKDELTLMGLKGQAHPVATEDMANYGWILHSLYRTLLRSLSSTLGIGQHHLYFRPLWDPKARVVRKSEYSATQWVGFEFQPINAYLPHLVDLASIQFALQVRVSDERSEWFLDHTNPKGDGLVSGSMDIRQFALCINGEPVMYQDLPEIYNFLRLREYNWHLLEENHVSHNDLKVFLSAYRPGTLVTHPLILLCHRLGLLVDGRLSESGRSLISFGAE